MSSARPACISVSHAIHASTSNQACLFSTCALLAGHLKHTSLVQLTVFCIASCQAMVMGLTPALTHCAPHLQDTQLMVPSTKWSVSAPVAILGPPVAAFVLIWALCREQRWAWPLQDIMGLSMMLLIFRQFRLPSIKVQVHCFHLLPLPLMQHAACCPQDHVTASILQCLSTE